VRSGLGQWLVEHRAARIGLIAGLLPLPVTSVLSAALVVTVTIARGWRVAVADCLLAFAVLGLVTISADGAWQQVALSGISTWATAMLLGALTGGFGTLTLSLQALLVIGVLGLGVFAVVVDNPTAFWESILARFAEQMSAFGMPLAEPEAVLELAPIMSGLVASSVVMSSTLALLIGTWWAGGAGGAEFRALFVSIRLGYVVGGIAVLAGLAALLGMGQVAGNVLLVLGIGFVFQGLAVVHWLVAARGLPWALLILVYLPMFLGASILVLTLFLLATVGFVDNWYGLRRAGRNER